MNISPVYNVFNQNRYKIANNVKKPATQVANTYKTPSHEKRDKILALGMIAAAGLAFGFCTFNTLKTGFQIKKAAKLANSEAESLLAEGKKIYGEMISIAQKGANDGYIDIVDASSSILTTFKRLHPDENSSVTTIIKQVDTRTGLGKRYAVLKDEKLINAAIFDSLGATTTDYTFSDGKLFLVDKDVVTFGEIGKTIEKRFLYDDNEHLSTLYKKMKIGFNAPESAQELFSFRNKKPTLFQKNVTFQNDNIDAKEVYLPNWLGIFKKFERNNTDYDFFDTPLGESLEEFTFIITDALFDRR